MKRASKRSTEYDGLLRLLFEASCELCEAKFWVPRHVIKTRRSCSLRCSRLLSRNRSQLVCGWCGSDFERATSRVSSKSGYVFCSRSCKDQAQSTGGIDAIKPRRDVEDAASTYRDRALVYYGAECLRCGYRQDQRMLDVHHVDGDRSNNALENLEVLCVWCHALDTRGVNPHSQPGRRGISLDSRAVPLQGSETGATPVSSNKGPEFV